jgi:hypothetical protein
MIHKSIGLFLYTCKLFPGGIRTPVFGSWGGCGVYWVTPGKELSQIWVRRFLSWDCEKTRSLVLALVCSSFYGVDIADYLELSKGELLQSIEFGSISKSFSNLCRWQAGRIFAQGTIFLLLPSCQFTAYMKVSVNWPFVLCRERYITKRMMWVNAHSFTLGSFWKFQR